MTGIYEWNPLPHKVDIRCPCCGEHTFFEFAEIVRITRKNEIPFFIESDFFEYHLFEDKYGRKWHGAIYYANLHGGSTKAIRDLPTGYSPEDWGHSKYLISNHAIDLGAVSCGGCQVKSPYILQWPNDAFYAISFKGELLWAFNRESALDLRDFIASSHRKVAQYSWSNFLLHIPTTFKKRNACDNIVKQLNRLLAR